MHWLSAICGALAALALLHSIGRLRHRSHPRRKGPSSICNIGETVVPIIRKDR